MGQATALDVLANAHRTRRKPEPPQGAGVLNNSPDKGPRTGPNLVELAHAQYHGHKRTARADNARVSTNTTREA
jgi:hypothetical protein